MDEVKWIKLAVDMFSDDKIKQIRALPDANALLVIWIQLLLLAGRVNQDGLLILSNTEIPYTEEMLATAFDMPLNTVLLAIRTFEGFGMIELIDDIYHITNWAKHQSVEGLDKIREQNRVRKQKERAKKKALFPAKEAPALPEPPSRFEIFWKAYPKKVGKGAAEKSFNKYKPSQALLETMLKAVEQAKQSAQWRRDGGQYIPNPATWLNQRRWEDELPVKEEGPTLRRGMEDWDEVQ